MKALQATSVTVELGGLQILRGVDLAVAVGERRVILGPNGAGKTTLFNVLTGMLRPTSGSVWLHGNQVTGWPPNRRARAGLGRTFQITDLMTSLTVRNNVALALAAHHTWVRRDALRSLARRRALLEEADALLSHWGMAGRSSLPVHALSYGDRRHLEIILAVASKPSVLLLDEPTAGLSPAETEEVIELVDQLGRELSIVVVEHDLSVAFRLADTVTVMVDGTVHAEGPAADDAVRRAVDELYIGALQLPDGRDARGH